MKSLLDSSAGIATCYELDGSGIELRCWKLFLHPSKPVLRPTQSVYIQYRVMPGVKRPGLDVKHSPHLALR